MEKDIEKKLGFVSSFNFVPERDYSVGKDLLNFISENGFSHSNQIKQELLGSFGVSGIKKQGKSDFNLEKCLITLYERILEDEIAQSLKPNGYTPTPDIQQMREFYLERVTEIIKDSFLLEKDSHIAFLQNKLDQWTQQYDLKKDQDINNLKTENQKMQGQL